MWPFVLAYAIGLNDGATSARRKYKEQEADNRKQEADNREQSRKDAERKRHWEEFDEHFRQLDRENADNSSRNSRRASHKKMYETYLTKMVEDLKNGTSSIIASNDDLARELEEKPLI